MYKPSKSAEKLIEKVVKLRKKNSLVSSDFITFSQIVFDSFCYSTFFSENKRLVAKLTFRTSCGRLWRAFITASPFDPLKKTNLTTSLMKIPMEFY